MLKKKIWQMLVVLHKSFNGYKMDKQLKYHEQLEP